MRVLYAFHVGCMRGVSLLRHGGLKDPSARIDFQFDEASFDFKALPFTIPYPVPFRWLGDEVRQVYLASIMSIFCCYTRPRGVARLV